MEQKPLPSHLKYAYLGVESTLPVIISASLTALEEEKLLRVIRDHKHALGWSLADLKGIRPSMCMHRILLQDGHKPSVEAQRRLNPTMKEVVRKEVLKWLDTGVIYCNTLNIFLNEFFSWNLSFRCFKVHHEFIIIFRNYFSIK